MFLILPVNFLLNGLPEGKVVVSPCIFRDTVYWVVKSKHVKCALEISEVLLKLYCSIFVFTLWITDWTSMHISFNTSKDILSGLIVSCWQHFFQISFPSFISVLKHCHLCKSMHDIDTKCATRKKLTGKNFIYIIRTITTVWLNGKMSLNGKKYGKFFF